MIAMLSAASIRKAITLPLAISAQADYSHENRVMLKHSPEKVHHARAHLIRPSGNQRHGQPGGLSENGCNEGAVLGIGGPFAGSDLSAQAVHWGSYQPSSPLQSPSQPVSSQPCNNGPIAQAGIKLQVVARLTTM